MNIEEEIAAKIREYLPGADGEADSRTIAAALMPLLNRVRAEAAAGILRTLLDGVVLSWHSRDGLTVWESEEHYGAGTPKPLMIHEWLEHRADRIEQNSEGSRT